MMKRYLIVTHDYNRLSAGGRALHKLAHYLNLAGCEAYVTSEVRNPAWYTPLAEAELQAEIARDGIVVYPEVEAGNRLGAAQVVRYILNTPGLIRGDSEFPTSEQLFAYTGLLRRHLTNKLNVLTVPVVEQSIFNLYGIGERKIPLVYWVGREKIKAYEHLTTNGVEITTKWPATWDTLAVLFKSARLFVSYTDYTMLTTEARLCGCPTVIVPSGRFSYTDFATSPPGISGLAYGLDSKEIDKAYSTVQRFPYDYQESVAQFYTQLYYFIDKTQRWA